MGNKIKNITLKFILISVSLFQPILGQAYDEIPDFLNLKDKRAQIMVLGTFHFFDMSHIVYDPKKHIDIFSEDRQREISLLLEKLEKYQPSKIAVEVRINKQKWLDSLYTAYLAGHFELKCNEEYQLGFRLAQRLGHKKVFAVDAKGRSYFENLTKEEYRSRIQKLDRPSLKIREWEERFNNLLTYEDSLMMTHSILDHLLYLNSPRRIQLEHGKRFVETFKLSHEMDYLGPDLDTRRINRDLRIVSNLQRITASGEERILLIIGKGHVPTIRFAIQSSPEYELIDVLKVLK